MDKFGILILLCLVSFHNFVIFKFEKIDNFNKYKYYYN